VPRLRVFAGPNGSGKSTIKALVSSELIGFYVNADEIERGAKDSGRIDLSLFDITATQAELQEFFTKHHLIRQKDLLNEAQNISLSADVVDFRSVKMNSYYASVLADFIRQRLLQLGRTFTFETVMSHESKVEFMRQAQRLGYRTYLYFVSTDSPDINVNRVAIRVSEGGHDVDVDKIIERYGKTHALLPQAIAASNRAYIFDNSGEESTWLAEITDGASLEYKTPDIPEWFFAAYIDKVALPA
jgi:predicted ABC-type ATPase